MNNFLYTFICGILIGTCMILPGVSGSVIAILLGVYDWVIILLNNKEYSSLEKLKMITPIAIGILIGIFAFGKVLLIFYERNTFEMMYIFIGLILGSIPQLINEIKDKGYKLEYGYTIITFIISVLIFILPKILKINSVNNFGFFNLFIAGFLYIAGKIIPGISSSLFLMILGLYEYLLSTILNPFNITLDKFILLIPFFIGIILGMFLIIKLLNYLFDKYFSKTYSCIIGFVLGSIISIFPGINISIQCGFSVLLMILSYLFVKKITKK